MASEIPVAGANLRGSVSADVIFRSLSSSRGFLNSYSDFQIRHSQPSVVKIISPIYERVHNNMRTGSIRLTFYARVNFISARKSRFIYAGQPPHSLDFKSRHRRVVDFFFFVKKCTGGLSLSF